MPNTIINRRVVLTNNGRLIPPPISGYSFWMRADGLNNGVSNNYGVVSSLGAVETWLSLDTNNTIYGRQTTGSFQPVLVSNAINGKKAIRFTAANTTQFDLINALSLCNAISKITIYAVYKVTTGGTAQQIVHFSKNADVNTRAAIISSAANANGVAARRPDSSGSAVVSGNSSLTTKIVCGVIDFSATTATFYENGTSISTNSSFLTAGSTDATNSSVAKIGGTGSGNYYDGDFAEVLVYIDDHNATEVAQTSIWLNKFYNLY